jgi:2-iminobutanoate/2-iminopropanoate deaminase
MEQHIVNRHLAVPELGDPSGYSYTHGVQSGRWLAIAGQCGVGADGQVVSLEFDEQARAVLERMEAVVRAAGGDRSHIVAMTVFITDIRYGAAFTAIRKEFFGKDFPTSALIGVSALMPDHALVEAQGWAHLPE